jgi:DNA-directed RNA polymerase specialized sigma24 family protein
MIASTIEIPPAEKFHKLMWDMANTCYAKLPHPKQLDPEDLFQEAYLAYRKAADGFDPHRGTKFITYLWFALRSHMTSILHRAYREANRRTTIDWEGETEPLDALESPSPPIQSEPDDPKLLGDDPMTAHTIRVFLDGSTGFNEWEANRYRYRAKDCRLRLARVLLYLGNRQERHRRLQGYVESLLRDERLDS